MEVTIYHNPACGTSVNALSAIRAAGHQPRIFEYLTTPLSSGAIASLIEHMKVPVRRVVRSKEPLFRELGLDKKKCERQRIDRRNVPTPRSPQSPDRASADERQDHCQAMPSE